MDYYDKKKNHSWMVIVIIFFILAVFGLIVFTPSPDAILWAPAAQDIHVE